MNKERLLNVARALRESPNPVMFDMGLYNYVCGTPGCAFGHYVARSDLQSEFGFANGWPVFLKTGEDAGAFSDESAAHFELDPQAIAILFDTHGCGGAKTALAAAEYIEAFVARHEATP